MCASTDLVQHVHKNRPLALHTSRPGAIAGRAYTQKPLFGSFPYRQTKKKKAKRRVLTRVEGTTLAIWKLAALDKHKARVMSCELTN